MNYDCHLAPRAHPGLVGNVYTFGLRPGGQLKLRPLNGEGQYVAREIKLRPPCGKRSRPEVSASLFNDRKTYNSVNCISDEMT